MELLVSGLHLSLVTYGLGPGHLHFVLRPSWNGFQPDYERPGPFLQVDMFKARVEPAREEEEALAAIAREAIGGLALSVEGFHNHGQLMLEALQEDKSNDHSHR